MLTNTVFISHIERLFYATYCSLCMIDLLKLVINDLISSIVIILYTSSVFPIHIWRPNFG